MRFSKADKRRAQELIDGGYAEFIGNIVPTLAMATQWRYVASKRLDDMTIIRRVPCGYSQERKHVASLEQHIRDKQAPIAQARDTAIDTIAQAGAPGSSERIAALAAHYAQHEQLDYVHVVGSQTMQGMTAFTIDSDGMASALAAALSRNPANRAEFIAAIHENRPIRVVGAGAVDGTIGVQTEGTTED